MEHRRFVLAFLLFSAGIASAAQEAFSDLVYEARKPEYAGLAKQSANFCAKLAALPDDKARAEAAASFAAYLERTAQKLSDAGRSAYAAEARGYLASVLAFREELLAPPSDPLAEAEEDPFAEGDEGDPFEEEEDPLDPLSKHNDDPLARPKAEPVATPKEIPPFRPKADPLSSETDDPLAEDNGDPLADAAEAPASEPQMAGDPPEPQYEEAPRLAAPAPAIPVLVQSERKFLVDPTRVTIDAMTPGIQVGPFEEGDLLVLRYASGTWTSDEKKHFPTTPDVPRMDDSERLAIVAGEDFVTYVPGQTDAAPFVYTVEEAGPLKLRIGEDPGGDLEHLDDNQGSVVYLAYVLGPEDAEAFRASAEGRKCQFGTTAAERRAAEEAEASKRGDPFTLVTTKKENGVDFDFTQNGGVFTIKVDGTEFATKWGKGPNDDLIFAYSDLVRQIGGKKGFKRLPNTPKGFDDLVFAPGSRPVRKGEVVVFQNSEGRLLAVRVDGIRLATAAPGSKTKLSIHYRVY